MAETKMSPMMAHYMETKKQYPDCILFFRLGDFYEMFTGLGISMRCSSRMRRRPPRSWSWC